MGRQRRKNTKKKDRPSPLNPISVNNPSQQRNKLKDNNNSCVVIDARQLCANCCSIIDAIPSEKTTHDIPSNSSSSQLECSANNDDDVNKMLLEIYNLDFIPRLQQKYYGAASGETDVVMETEEAKVFDFPLCRICKNLLKCLFSLYSQFNQIRKIEGLLSKQINTLNTLINYDPGQQQQKQQQSSPKTYAKDERAFFVSQSKTVPATTTTTNALSSSKFLTNCQEPCVSVNIGLRLEDRTIGDLGYVPPSLRHRTFQEAPQSRKELTSGPDDPEKDASSSDNSKFVFPAHDRGPWVKVGGSTLKDKTDKDPASVILRDLYQCQEPPASTLIISNVVSIQPSHDDDDDAQNDNDHDNDNDMDYEPSCSSHNDDDDMESENYEEEDLKPFKPALDLELDLEPESPKISREIAEHSSTVKSPRILRNGPKIGIKEKVFSSRAEKERYKRRQLKAPCPCIYCQENFQNPEDRAAHVREKHFADRNYLCQTCGAVFKEQDAFSFHQNQSAYHKCSAFYKVNLRKKEPIKPGTRLECTECHKLYTNAVSLKFHFKRFHTEKGRNVDNAKKKKFACTFIINNEGQVCPYRTIAQAFLKTHVLNVHADENQKAQCRECHRVFKTEFYLNQHFYKEHTEKGRNAYRRELEKRFEIARARRRDVESKGFVCSHCGQEFTHKVTHTVHLRSVHNDYSEARLKILVCDHCGKKCVGTTNLTKHMRVHTGERPFVCEECGRSYRTQKDLRGHKTVHTDERPFVCEDCGRSYKSQKRLSAHKSVAHSEEGRRKWNVHQAAYKRMLYQKQKARKEAETATNRSSSNNIEPEMESNKQD